MGDLFKKLREYADSDFLPMHMPGHKRRMGELGDPFFIDITEIDGFDDLHHADGILLDAQKRAAKLYGSEETHYLVNGSTAGILSAISGCVSRGGKILLARNSHKSAYHGVFLRDLRAEYIYPQSAGNMLINGEISPSDVDELLKRNPDAQAVMITSPTYDGIVSDVEGIAGVAHSYGIPLIVDEAHGAHFPFSDHFPKDSVSCGADVVVHSLHKTLPSLTQTALIHLNGSLIDRERIRKYLTIYQSSSPSYVLMAGMDNCIEWISGHREAFDRFWEQTADLRAGLRRMRHLKLLEAPGMDESKILVSVQATGLTGNELAGLLRENYHIEVEMACSSYVCAIASVADDEESLGRLLNAFLAVDSSIHGSENPLWAKNGRGAELPGREKRLRGDAVLPAVQVCTIQQAEECPAEICGLTEAVGRVSGDFVMLYPPGIPILAPGEKISPDIADRLVRYLEDGFDVHGIRDHCMKVLKEQDGR